MQEKCEFRGNGCFLSCPPRWSDIECVTKEIYSFYYHPERFDEEPYIIRLREILEG
jgi:hypothetical protein